LDTWLINLVACALLDGNPKNGAQESMIQRDDDNANRINMMIVEVLFSFFQSKKELFLKKKFMISIFLLVELHTALSLLLCFFCKANTIQTDKKCA
jgi:hypothetical protein